MLIRELIVENFMSYEYARVPLRSGVNVIGGPNGAGKSSLLLAISVGLGQTYTERSKKLSDLIRWGQDQARVTLILDNSKVGAKRPVTKYQKDQLFLTRTLRKDGKYWFELENRAVSKQEVDQLLGKFGVDPNNMLIIMHQNMVEQFSVLSNIEKLRMVEAAVGLEPFRENVVQARTKLTRILSQEESVGKLLEQAHQTLNYWREQYEKFQEKKQLQLNRRFLERELVWAEVERRENIVKNLQTDLNKSQKSLEEIYAAQQTINTELDQEAARNQVLKSEIKILFNQRLILEREVAHNQATLEVLNQLIKETQILQTEVDNDQFKWLRNKTLSEMIEFSSLQINKTLKQIEENQTKMILAEESKDTVSTSTLDKRVALALLGFRRENLTNEIKKIQELLQEAQEHFNNYLSKAKEFGDRIVVVKSVGEIQAEMGQTNGHLAALGSISEEIERQYESYSRLYLELKEKAQLVAENREKTLEEVKTRFQSWRSVMESLLERVNVEYQRIMEQALATGAVQLSNAQDIETAGLEIYVGFKGSKPVALDAYTQSGGERTTATMGFLLALQQHVRSPFRAVDEYDIHMDPKNREMIGKVLLSMIKDARAQYVVITPSQITFAKQDASVVAVQNLEGKSLAREVD